MSMVRHIIGPVYRICLLQWKVVCVHTGKRNFINPRLLPLGFHLGH